MDIYDTQILFHGHRVYLLPPDNTADNPTPKQAAGTLKAILAGMVAVLRSDMPGAQTHKEHQDEMLRLFGENTKALHVLLRDILTHDAHHSNTCNSRQGPEDEGWSEPDKCNCGWLELEKRIRDIVS